LTTKQLRPALEKDFHLVRANHELNYAKPENVMLHQVIRPVFSVHIVGLRRLPLHGRTQRVPFFPFSSVCFKTVPQRAQRASTLSPADNFLMFMRKFPFHE
jgi:hypothetical protein